MNVNNEVILAADDDPQILTLICRTLQLEGYEVLKAQDGLQALNQAYMHRPDLVILDVMMPKLNGFEACTSLREFTKCPILFLSAYGQEDERIRGLDLGADDYITKPFVVNELLARVRAMLRRTQMANAKDLSTLRGVITLGDLTVDCGQKIVTLGGQQLKLSHLEYRLLLALAQQAGRVVSQDDLLESVWGKQYRGETHLLQVNINRLRHKLEADPDKPRYLLTKPSAGYMLLSPQENKGLRSCHFKPFEATGVR